MEPLYSSTEVNNTFNLTNNNSVQINTTVDKTAAEARRITHTHSEAQPKKNSVKEIKLDVESITRTRSSSETRRNSIRFSPREVIHMDDIASVKQSRSALAIPATTPQRIKRRSTTAPNNIIRDALALAEEGKDIEVEIKKQLSDVLKNLKINISQIDIQDIKGHRERQLAASALEKEIKKFEILIQNALFLGIFSFRSGQNKHSVSLANLVAKVQEAMKKNPHDIPFKAVYAKSILRGLKLEISKQEDAIKFDAAKRLQNALKAKIAGKSPVLNLLLTMHRGGDAMAKEQAGIVSPEALLTGFLSITTPEGLFKAAHQSLNILHDLRKTTPTLRADVVLQQKRIFVFLQKFIKCGYFNADLRQKGPDSLVSLLENKIIPYGENRSSKGLQTEAKSLKKLLNAFKKSHSSRALKQLNGSQEFSKNLMEGFNPQSPQFEASVNNIAEDLRCISRNSFSAIPIRDFFVKMDRKDSAEKAPQWMGFANEVNAISRFVQDAILNKVPEQPDLKAASSASAIPPFTKYDLWSRVSFFADVALKCLKLHDYHSAFTIQMAFSSVPIERILRDSMTSQFHKGVPTKLQSKIDKLNKIFDLKFINLGEKLKEIKDEKTFHIYPGTMLSRLLLTAIDTENLPQKCNAFEKLLKPALIAQKSTRIGKGLKIQPRTNLQEKISEFAKTISTANATDAFDDELYTKAVGLRNKLIGIPIRAPSKKQLR